MAKKDKKKKDDKAGDDTFAAVRSAVERALGASAEGAQSTRERTREIVEEISAAAGRIRHTLEDMRVLDEVKRLRSEVEALAQRVSKLEIKPPAATSSASGSTATKRPAAAKSAAARKPAAKRKPAARRKPAAKRTAAKRKPAARKPASKPAAGSS
jgi:hypothetical protein